MPTSESQTELDQKDVKILFAVAELGTGSPDKISAAIDIPKSTVHYRLEKLQDRGIITNDLFDIDLEKIGLNLTIITEVQAEYKEGYHDEVGRKLTEIEGANQVYFMMGKTDFTVISHLANREMVEKLIEQFEAIEEITRTNSKFVIKTLKDESYPLNDFEIETILAEI
ncbi:Lrp/AsnC family transcriptional regulator [Haloplanus salinarum]|uniref:Lrp/AsnC family transcriptional regulator n=1 Tax=Haloplanus salinarum TaxID=1912324 RepID=UPI003B42AFE4